VTDQRPFFPGLSPGTEYSEVPARAPTFSIRAVAPLLPVWRKCGTAQLFSSTPTVSAEAGSLVFHRHRWQTRTRVGISRRTFSLTRPIQRVSTARRLIPSPRLKCPERLSGRALSTTASSGPVTATSRETLHSICLITPPVARAPTSRPSCGRGPRPQLQGCPWPAKQARELLSGS
jgi:hypothetical protein